MKFVVCVFFLLGLTFAGASNPYDNEQEESLTPVAVVFRSPELLANILSFVRDQETLKNSALVCRFWRGNLMRNICFIWDDQDRPVEVRLNRRNVLTWLERFAGVPAPLIDNANVFSDLENTCCALSAFLEGSPAAAHFLEQLNRPDIWRLTWSLQNQARVFQNDQQLRVLHQSLLRGLLEIADIPTLSQTYNSVFDGTLTEAQYATLITPFVEFNPQLAVTATQPYNPTDARRLFFAFCLAHERQLFILQVLNRLNFTQLFIRNGYILTERPWGEEERQQHYCPIENPQSLFQYVVDEPQKGVFRVLMEKQDIDMNEYAVHRRIIESAVVIKPLFEVTAAEFHFLGPLRKFMSLRTLHFLLDKRTVQTVLPDLTKEGLQTLYDLTKERFLRTRDADDLKFMKIYEKGTSSK